MNCQERGADNDGIDEICGSMVGVGGGGEVKKRYENGRAAKHGGKTIVSRRKRDRVGALARMR